VPTVRVLFQTLSPGFCSSTAGGMAEDTSKPGPVTVILPDEPPVLTPEAARTMLRILVKARERQDAEKRDADTGDYLEQGGS
jgi:hypothetical protein